MRSALALALVFAFGTLLASGCLRHTSYDSCHVDGDCAAAGAGAHCESNGSCSVDDSGCPSGRRYHSSSPAGDMCVPADSFDAPLPDATPIAAGRECVNGEPLPTGYSACAAMVDAKEPRCGTETWDNVCVRWTETLCQQPCSQMAFVGASQQPFVLRLDDGVVLWQDNNPSNDGAVTGSWSDYDNDGDPDLAIAGDDLLRIMKNTGYDASGGSLVLQPVLTVNWGTISSAFPEFSGTDVQWADIDQDGDMDAIFAGYGGLIVIRNDGDDVFVPEAPLWQTTAGADSDADPVGPNIIRIALGDYDHDGWPDLALVRFGHPPQIWHNDHGTLSDSGWLLADGPSYPQFGGGVKWCNVDADPEPELISAGYDYVIIVNNAGGVMSTSYNLLNAQAGSDVECGDFDGDGDLDLVVSGDDMQPSRAYTNHGTIQSFTQSWVDTDATTDMIQRWWAAVGDIDGDHVLDFVGAGNEDSTPAEFQLYKGTSIANKVQFTPTTHALLDSEQQSAHAMALAPTIGH